MLFDQIKSDRIQAMKSKDKVKTDLLGCVLGESSKIDKVPSDEKVIGTIRKFLKGVDETIKVLSGRDDKSFTKTETNYDKYKQWEKSVNEEFILQSYLPTLMDENAIRNTIGKSPHRTVKDIMTFMKEKYSGKYDGKIVSQIAKEFVDK